VRLDEVGGAEAQRIERLGRQERRRAFLQTLALWGIAIGALVLAFR
jgi:ubiquinone biosynthesis protein